MTMTNEQAMMIGSAMLSGGAIAMGLYVLISRMRDIAERRRREADNRAQRAARETFREMLGAKLLAGGYGKHHAYHVASDGRLLVVDSADLQLAEVSGFEAFWYHVAQCDAYDAANNGASAFSVSLDEIDLGDGKGDFTYIRNCCGEAFVDGLLPIDYSAHSHYCARVTAEDFKNAVVDAQAEAAERNRGCKAYGFHR